MVYKIQTLVVRVPVSIGAVGASAILFKVVGASTHTFFGKICSYTHLKWRLECQNWFLYKENEFKHICFQIPNGGPGNKGSVNEIRPIGKGQKNT